MNTLSSPRLRKLYEEQALSYNNSGILDKFVKKDNSPKQRSFWNEYAREQQRLLARRGSPTLADYRLLEQ